MRKKIANFTNFLKFVKYAFSNYDPHVGTMVEFSGLADRVDLLPVNPNSRGGRTSSSKILND